MTTSMVSARLDDNLIALIDARAKTIGISRTEWLSRCATWAIVNLPLPNADGSPITNIASKVAFRDTAPEEEF